jgi:hypothetical protein
MAKRERRSVRDTRKSKASVEEEEERVWEGRQAWPYMKSSQPKGLARVGRFQFGMAPKPTPKAKSN